MLHVSGSMSTGADFGAPQWRQLATILQVSEARCCRDQAWWIVQERQLIPLIIMASQGLSSGDPNRDAQPVRFMVHEGLAVVLVQSFDAVSFT